MARDRPGHGAADPGRRDDARLAAAAAGVASAGGTGRAGAGARILAALIGGAKANLDEVPRRVRELDDDATYRC